MYISICNKTEHKDLLKFVEVIRHSLLLKIYTKYLVTEMCKIYFRLAGTEILCISSNNEKHMIWKFK